MNYKVEIKSKEEIEQLSDKEFDFYMHELGGRRLEIHTEWSILNQQECKCTKEKKCDRCLQMNALVDEEEKILKSVNEVSEIVKEKITKPEIQKEAKNEKLLKLFEETFEILDKYTGGKMFSSPFADEEIKRIENLYNQIKKELEE